MQQILKVTNLTLSIDNTPVLEDISFEVNKGEILAIIGPNGAGKTTLFKALLNLLPYKGKVEWQKGIKIGYVPQRIEIDKDVPLTVLEFLKMRGPHVSAEKIKNILGLVQLKTEILDFGLGEVSVGQRQRLLVAWSILGNPDVILFDEPTADVDIHGQESIYKMITGLREKARLTIILISHDLNVVYQYADKVLCLNHQNICIGAPAEILKTEQLQELYGGERGFYHHDHKHNPS